MVQTSMSSDMFAMWLNGFFELSGAEELTKEQVKIIKEHLNLVMNKVTPSSITITKENPFDSFKSTTSTKIPTTLIC